MQDHLTRYSGAKGAEGRTPKAREVWGRVNAHIINKELTIN